MGVFLAGLTWEEIISSGNVHTLLRTYPETVLTMVFKSSKKGKDFFFCFPLSATSQLL